MIHMSDGWGALPSGQRYGTTGYRTTPTGIGLAGPNPGLQTSAPAARLQGGGFNNHSFTESFMGLGNQAIQGNGFMNSELYKKLDKMDAKEVDKYFEEQQQENLLDQITTRAAEPPKNVRPRNMNPPSSDEGWGGDAEDGDFGGDDE